MLNGRHIQVSFMTLRGGRERSLLTSLTHTSTLPEWMHPKCKKNRCASSIEQKSSRLIRLMCKAKRIRYKVGRWEGRSGLFFDSGLLSLVISGSYGRVNPPPSAVHLRSFGASAPGGPPSHNRLKSRRPSAVTTKRPLQHSNPKPCVVLRHTH